MARVLSEFLRDLRGSGFNPKDPVVHTRGRLRDGIQTVPMGPNPNYNPGWRVETYPPIDVTLKIGSHTESALIRIWYDTRYYYASDPGGITFLYQQEQDPDRVEDMPPGERGPDAPKKIVSVRDPERPKHKPRLRRFW